MSVIFGSLFNLLDIKYEQIIFGHFPTIYNKYCLLCHIRGAQWLSGRVLDSRLRGHGLEPHWRHCAVVF